MGAKLSRSNKVCLVITVIILALVWFFIGRVTAGTTRVETRTITVEVPAYEEDAFPEVEDIVLFDIPLSENLQRFIYEMCADEGIPVTLVIAMIDYESEFDQDAVSDTDDYGLMQINTVNHEMLAEEYRCADMLNSYQNVFCGIKIIASYMTEFDGDYPKVLMAYNMGHYGAQKAWESGMVSSAYEQGVLSLMQEYEEELNEQ